jgi:hypothetical protein
MDEEWAGCFFKSVSVMHDGMKAHFSLIVWPAGFVLPVFTKINLLPCPYTH